MNTERLALMYQLRLEGLTYQKIADRFGLSKQRVHQIITRYKPNQGRPTEQQKKTKINQQQIKLKVLTHYGKGKCACVLCGFGNIKALSIDHIASYGYEDKHGNALYRSLIKMGFPIGYQTLCMNCQWIKRNIRNETCLGRTKGKNKPQSTIKTQNKNRK